MTITASSQARPMPPRIIHETSASEEAMLLTNFLLNSAKISSSPKRRLISCATFTES